MRKSRTGVVVWSVLALLLVCGAEKVSGQEPTGCAEGVDGAVVVYGDVPEALVLPWSELKDMPRVSFTGTFHDGRPAEFSGVTLWEVLQRAGLPEELRSEDLASSVVVEARDGYRVLFALAELDPSFRAEVPLLADEEAGRPIAEKFGPLQVVVPGELRQSRWIRQVECVRVLRPG